MLQRAQDLEQFCTYAAFLKEYNEKINLTAICEFEEVLDKHFYDSLLLSFDVKMEGTLVDVGTGAGFPGVVLKIRTCGVKITGEQLVNEAMLPCILYWNNSHFVVCYKIKRKRGGKLIFYIADPASQRLQYEEDEFKKCWLGVTLADVNRRGIALLLEPNANFANIEEE